MKLMKLFKPLEDTIINVITKHEDDSYLEELKDRADYLKKYLDM